MDIQLSFTSPKYFPPCWNILGKIPWLPKNVVLVFTEQKELDVNSDYLKEIDSFKVDDTTRIFWFPANMFILESSWWFLEEAAQFPWNVDIFPLRAS